MSIETSEVDEMVQIIDMKKKDRILKIKKCISLLKATYISPFKFRLPLILLIR